MKRISVSVLSLFLLSAWSHPMNSAYGTGEDIVKVQIYKAYDQIHPGMDLKIALRADILGTWHINSNLPEEDLLVATDMDIPSDSAFHFAKIKFPEPSSLLLEFSDKPVSVFDGQIFIGGVVPIPEDIALGKHTIPLHFTYQACNDSACLPPETVEEKVVITVVDKETPISEVNVELFAKLGF